MRRVMLLGALALLLAGCSTESALPTTDIPPFKVDPAVSIRLSALSGGDATFELTAVHFKLVDPASASATHVYGEGHFHLFLDVPPTAPGEVTPHAPGIYHTPDSTYTIHGLKDGPHHLVVVLGYSDHLPYQDIIQKTSATGGAIASLDFRSGSGATPVTTAPSAAPSAAASSAPTAAASAPATAGGGGGPTVHLVTDAANGGAFNPGTATVSVGGTVTWVWDDDSASHTVTADNNSFDSSLQAKGFKYTQTFKSAGTYKYHCAVHPQMVGTIKVQ